MASVASDPLNTLLTPLEYTDKTPRFNQMRELHSCKGFSEITQIQRMVKENLLL